MYSGVHTSTAGSAYSGVYTCTVESAQVQWGLHIRSGVSTRMVESTRV